MAIVRNGRQRELGGVRRDSRRPRARRRPPRRRPRTSRAVASEHADPNAACAPAACCAVCRRTTADTSRARLRVAGQARDDRARAVEPHQPLVVAELRAHARGKFARVGRRLRGKSGVPSCTVRSSVRSGAGTTLYKQIAPRQHVQHFVHERRRASTTPMLAIAGSARRVAVPSGTATSSPVPRRSAGSGSRMASTPNANASAAASGAAPAGSFA